MEKANKVELKEVESIKKNCNQAVPFVPVVPWSALEFTTVTGDHRRCTMCLQDSFCKVEAYLKRNWPSKPAESVCVYPGFPEHYNTARDNYNWMILVKDHFTCVIFSFFLFKFSSLPNCCKSTLFFLSFFLRQITARSASDASDCFESLCLHFWTRFVLVFCSYGFHESRTAGFIQKFPWYFLETI